MKKRVHPRIVMNSPKPQNNGVITKLHDYLYISGIHALSKEKIEALNITCVVDATSTPKDRIDYLPDNLKDYIKVDIEDTPKEPLHLYFEPVSHKIQEHRFSGGRTLVHCYLGMSRSAALCLAYFVSCEEMPLKDAYLFMRSRRRIVRPNFGFWEQLITWEKLSSKTHTTTVKMVKTKQGDEYLPDILLQLRSGTDPSLNASFASLQLEAQSSTVSPGISASKSGEIVGDTIDGEADGPPSPLKTQPRRLMKSLRKTMSAQNLLRNIKLPPGCADLEPAADGESDE